MLYFIFNVSSYIGWSGLRPFSLGFCFPPMGWRCFLLHFREVMPSLPPPPLGRAASPSFRWMVLLSTTHPSSAAALSLSPFCGAAFLPTSFGWCCFLFLLSSAAVFTLSHPSGGAAFSLFPCRWRCCPFPCSFLFGGWCGLLPSFWVCSFSASFVVLPSLPPPLGGAAVLLSLECNEMNWM